MAEQGRFLLGPNANDVPEPRIRRPPQLATVETPRLQRHGPRRLAPGGVSPQDPTPFGSAQRAQQRESPSAAESSYSGAASSSDDVGATLIPQQKRAEWASDMRDAISPSGLFAPEDVEWEAAPTQELFAVHAVHASEDFRLHGGPSPGSTWHAELCSRPCIYFASGNCIHGDTCPFCHLPHDKRPPHLDKRNRRVLRGICGSELYRIVMPEIAKKLKELSTALPHLWVAISPLVDFQGMPAPRVDSRFQAVFRNMTIRQLFNILGQKLQDEGQSPERVQFQKILMFVELERSAAQHGVMSL